MTHQAAGESQDLAVDARREGAAEPVSASRPRRVKHQYAAVLKRLAERRQELGMSMSALARKVDVSPSMISQIEGGQSLPSVETLFALADALGATVDTFFETSSAGPDPHSGEGGPGNDRPADGISIAIAGGLPAAGAHGDRYFVPRDGRAAISIQGGIRWERLTPRAMRDLDFLELIYEPGAQSSEHLYPHAGLEMVLVLSGRLEIYIGFDRYVLDAGDSIAFPSSIPHRYVNPLRQESRAVTTIVHDPHAGGGHSSVATTPTTRT